MVRTRGLEPPRLAAPDPKSGVSANSTTRACNHGATWHRLILWPKQNERQADSGAETAARLAAGFWAGNGLDQKLDLHLTYGRENLIKAYMGYLPQYTITPALLNRVEQIAARREQILAAAVQVQWIPALQKDTRTRNTHSSTAIEGNPLTLEQVRAIEEGREIPAVAVRAKREVANYFAGLRFVEKNATKAGINHEDIFTLHKIIAGEVMDQGAAGRYRTIAVKVGRYLPPPPQDVSGLMFELLTWWNQDSVKLSPVLSSAILHYRFEAIHPFADGNGRCGRAIALWELYRRGFDTHHIFPVDEFYWENRPRYYDSLDATRREGEDLTSWLEYSAEGLHQTLERVWARVQNLSAQAGGAKLVLRPKQEQLLRLLRDQKSLSPREIWDSLGVSKQGALDLVRPLIKAGLVRRVGTKKMGRYILK